MKVKCVEDSVANWVDSLGSSGYTAENQFDTLVGRVYVVYAICLWRNALLFLVEAIAGRPAWYPAVLFEVQDTNMPPSWRFAHWGRDRHKEVKAVWGYEELVTKEGHFNALSEQDREALRTFEKRKGLIIGE